MSSADQIVLLSTRGVLVGLFVALIILLVFKKPLKNYLKYSLTIGVITIIISNILAVLFFYFNLKKSIFGQMLIGGPGSFFFEQAIAAVKDLLLIFVIALAAYLITNRIVKLQKKPFLEEELPSVLFLSIIATNYIEAIVILSVGVALALIFAVVKSIKSRKISGERFGLAPFIAIASVLVLVAGMFPFYYDLLVKLKLI